MNCCNEDVSDGGYLDSTPTAGRDLFSGRFSVHGLAIELTCHVDALVPDLEHVFAPFYEYDWPEGFAATSGTIHSFEQTDVVRHLSPAATLVEDVSGLMELYADGERFWLVDERWGICEINVLKSQWRSWILPTPQIDSFQCVEMAILWPLAQLLRNKGLHLIPAAAVATDAWAALVMSRGSIDRELVALADSGINIIGQRWTAVREDDGGRLSMLHIPGLIENTPSTRRLSASAAGDSIPRWIDLESLYPKSQQRHAFCDAVLMIEPGRRPCSRMTEVLPINAVHALRRNWPIADLQPNRRQGKLASRLSQACRCFEIQLSREPRDLAGMIQSIQGLDMTPWSDIGVGEMTSVLLPQRMRSSWEQRRLADRPMARAS